MATNDDHLNNEELKLEILRIVIETGKEFQKNDPFPLSHAKYSEDELIALVVELNLFSVLDFIRATKPYWKHPIVEGGES